VLAAAGSNLRKLLGAIASALICRLWSRLPTVRQSCASYAVRFLTA
jgi:hypothetical protein